MAQGVLFLGLGPMPWEAYATLVGAGATLAAGAAAVIAAFAVGIRQAKIADSQTAILNLQARTDALRLRSELYDRRIRVYLVIISFLERLMEIEPDQHEMQKLDEYVNAVNEAKFLLSPQFNDMMEEAWPKVLNAVEARSSYLIAITTIFTDSPLDVTAPTQKRVAAAAELPAIRAQIQGQMEDEVGLHRPEISN